MDMPIKALSVRQPWTWAILNAGKRIENRPQRFKYRGPICLHASLFKDAGMHTIARLAIGKASQVDAPERFDVTRGGIVGTATIVDCIDSSDDPWWIGPFGLVLEDVKPVDFIAVKGQLGLFNWRRNLVANAA